MLNRKGFFKSVDFAETNQNEPKQAQFTPAKAHSQAQRRKPGRPGMTPERFWESVDRRGPDECWSWTRAKIRDGYGRLSWNGRDSLAHRVAFELAKHPIPAVGLVVMHSCDNRACCNPAHLSLGTLDDNNQDCKRKGRNTRGERVHSAKLTADDVREMRRLFSTGQASRYELASRYEVTHTQVCNIIRRVRWKDVV